jgi:hypothetical protein
MADDKTEFWIWGAIIAALTGMYGFFIKHIVGHVSMDDYKERGKQVQYRDNCIEIVKRQDERHRELCKKLDQIWEKLNCQS